MFRRENWKKKMMRKRKKVFANSTRSCERRAFWDEKRRELPYLEKGGVLNNGRRKKPRKPRGKQGKGSERT